MKSAFVFIAASMVATSAYCYTLDCSSADSKLQYQYSQSDGGASRAPTELLRVDGQDVINATVPGGPAFRIGKIEFGTKQTAIKDSQSGFYKTSYYAAVARVLSSKGKLIGSDLVLCKAVVYMGPPRP